mmetsp:Transcript_750/g.1750  ORF Transcript_750/g.1750 Transcript_750/m.1750 type:complete len:82 (-) Transcript_750:107-352(-)
MSDDGTTTTLRIVLTVTVPVTASTRLVYLLSVDDPSLTLWAKGNAENTESQQSIQVLNASTLYCLLFYDISSYFDVVRLLI